MGLALVQADAVQREPGVAAVATAGEAADGEDIRHPAVLVRDGIETGCLFDDGERVFPVLLLDRVLGDHVDAEGPIRVTHAFALDRDGFQADRFGGVYPARIGANK